MRAFWDSREPREKILIGVMLALLAGSILWFAVTRDGGNLSPKEILAEAQADRELWLRAAPRLNAGAGPTAERGAFSRAVLIDQARRRGIALSRVQPQAEGELAVWIDSVDAVSFYNLINELTRGYDVVVKSTLISTATDGSLNTQFTLASN